MVKKIKRRQDKWGENIKEKRGQEESIGRTKRGNGSMRERPGPVESTGKAKMGNEDTKEKLSLEGNTWKMKMEIGSMRMRNSMVQRGQAVSMKKKKDVS
jgi:hypothetical protein